MTDDTLHPAPDPDTFEGHKFDIVLGEAMDAFWASIAEGYPEVKTGDLDPLSDHQFRSSAEVVLRAWLWSNVPAIAEAWEAAHDADGVAAQEGRRPHVNNEGYEVHGA